MSTRIPRADLLATVCTTCLALPGEPCTVTRPDREWHPARVNAAKKKAAQR